jgi:hypothetical protein
VAEVDELAATITDAHAEGYAEGHADAATAIADFCHDRAAAMADQAARGVLVDHSRTCAAVWEMAAAVARSVAASSGTPEEHTDD